MEISWSTFFLEIINFLVLVWILNRLLYRPVTKAIEERKNSVKNELIKAQEKENKAKLLEGKYHSMLSEWQQKSDSRRTELENEVNEEKHKRIAGLKEQMLKLKEKQISINNYQRQKEKNILTNEAIELAMRFLSKLLVKFSDKQLQNKMILCFIDEMVSLSEKEKLQLKNESDKLEKAITISVAYQLDENQISELNQSLRSILGESKTFEFKLLPELIAGIYINLGALAIRFNLRDELAFFGEIKHVDTSKENH